jgi:hypothetical protein
MKQICFLPVTRFSQSKTSEPIKINESFAKLYSFERIFERYFVAPSKSKYLTSSGICQLCYLLRRYLLIVDKIG